MRNGLNRLFRLVLLVVLSYDQSDWWLVSSWSRLHQLFLTNQLKTPEQMLTLTPIVMSVETLVWMLTVMLRVMLMAALILMSVAMLMINQ